MKRVNSTVAITIIGNDSHNALKQLMNMKNNFYYCNHYNV